MCVIDHDNKLIYIAIPKTGTCSTQTFLRKISSIIEDYSDYHSIAVIRNPYDWYVSWFTFRKRNGAKISSKNMSFKEYLNKQPHNELLSWICDDNDNIIVDSIIKYEDGIEDQMINIISKIISKNINLKMKKKNISKKRKHKDYKIYYNYKTKKIVEKLQSRTLQKFGYKF